jgi:hypothetical protein
MTERMYRAGSPSAGSADGSHGEPLRVARAQRRVFEGSSESALDPMLRAYLSDLVAPYGLALRDDLLDQGAGQSYGEMAGALLEQTVLPGQPVDLLVLAFAVHDVIPGRSTAAHLSHLCPGTPMAFAVCDQGSAAPYTGLRLIREYTRTPGCRRALLVVVEQATLHYEHALASVPTQNAAVMLACGPAGYARLDTVRQHAGVSPAQAASLLVAELTALAAGHDDVTLIVGRGLASLGRDAGPPGPLTDGRELLPRGSPAVDHVVLAPAGQPTTGVWWELAGGLPGWTAQGRRVLLADFEPDLRYLSVSAIDVEPAPAGAASRPTAQRVR